MNTLKSWIKRYKWAEEKKKGAPPKRKRGAPLNNKNSVGNKGGSAPDRNKNAEKYGFFSKYLPEETKEIFDAVAHADPLDLLWHQIQIAYAAIIRAQKIAYVKDQQVWDKQNDFLKAQARAQAELRNMIKQYDEMLHKNWDLATEEQRTRIDVMKAKAQLDETEEIADDGFLEALKGTAAEDWADEEEDT